MGKEYAFVLKDGLLNLYVDIRDEALSISNKTRLFGGRATIPPVMYHHLDSLFKSFVYNQA